MTRICSVCLVKAYYGLFIRFYVMCFVFLSNNQTLQQGWAPYNWRSKRPQSQIVAVQQKDFCWPLANRGTVHEDLRLRFGCTKFIQSWVACTWDLCKRIMMILLKLKRTSQYDVSYRLIFESTEWI